MRDSLLIPGRMPERQLRALNSAARDAARRNRFVFLEMGSLFGRSASVLCRHRFTVLVDVGFKLPSDANADLDVPQRFKHSHGFLKHNLRSWIGRYVLLRGMTMDVLPTLSTAFSFTFVDAGHDHKNTAYNLKQAKRLTCRKGIICVHDYDDKHPESKRAIDEFLHNNQSEGWKTSQYGSLLRINL